MATRDPPDLIQEFLGSAHIFSETVREVVEERVLGDVSGGRLSFAQYKLLRLVARTDGHSIGEVASFLGVSDAAASKSVDKLVRRRFVCRSESKSDRRIMHLTLLDQGRRVVEAYEAARDRKMAEVFAAFPSGELHLAAALLDRLSATLVDHGASPDEICLQCGIYFRDKCLVRQLGKRNCFYGRHGHRSHEAGSHGNGAASTPAANPPGRATGASPRGKGKPVRGGMAGRAR